MALGEVLIDRANGWVSGVASGGVSGSVNGIGGWLMELWAGNVIVVNGGCLLQLQLFQLRRTKAGLGAQPSPSRRPTFVHQSKHIDPPRPRQLRPAPTPHSPVALALCAPAGHHVPQCGLNAGRPQTIGRQRTGYGAQQLNAGLGLGLGVGGLGLGFGVLCFGWLKM